MRCWARQLRQLIQFQEIIDHNPSYPTQSYAQFRLGLVVTMHEDVG